MVIDVFTYNGEKEMLDLHLNILKDHVDEFIICEAPLTFTGKEKPLYFKEVEHLYKDFPIKYYVIDENDPELWEMARNSPNTHGAEHWKREFVHKESIKKALTHLSPFDTVFIGDCDEIWNPIIEIGDGLSIPSSSFVEVPPGKDENGQDHVIKWEMDVYTYFLNNKSSEKFRGTIMGRYWTIENNCLNHLRSDDKYWYKQFNPKNGWHFTSMGGLDALKKKLGDQYTEESYWNSEVQNNLESRFGTKDFLGRGFTYTIDESDWPQYLKDNREKYKHLCQ